MSRPTLASLSARIDALEAVIASLAAAPAPTASAPTPAPTPGFESDETKWPRLTQIGNAVPWTNEKFQELVLKIRSMREDGARWRYLMACKNRPARQRYDIYRAAAV